MVSCFGVLVDQVQRLLHTEDVEPKRLDVFAELRSELDLLFRCDCFRAVFVPLFENRPLNSSGMINQILKSRCDTLVRDEPVLRRTPVSLIGSPQSKQAYAISFHLTACRREVDSCGSCNGLRHFEIAGSTAT